MQNVSALVLVGLASCYSPHYNECVIACTTSVGCPDGLACDHGKCGTASCALGDGGSCWPFVPRNFDPCSASRGPYPPSIGPLRVPPALTIDTAPPSQGNLYDAGSVVLLHVDSLVVDAGATLIVTGPRPLLVVADGPITIAG